MSGGSGFVERVNSLAVLNLFHSTPLMWATSGQTTTKFGTANESQRSQQHQKLKMILH